ncbi:hypothetical protein PMAYCL1PPCAC_02380, partial [Pristionchus mayeri]
MGEDYCGFRLDEQSFEWRADKDADSRESNFSFDDDHNEVYLGVTKFRIQTGRSGIAFLNCSSILTQAPLRNLLTLNSFPDECISHCVPGDPTITCGTSVYIVCVGSLGESADTSTDNLSPWTIGKKSSRVRKVDCDFEEDKVTCIGRGSYTLRSTKYDHPRVPGLTKHVIRCEDASVPVGYVIIAYTSKMEDSIVRGPVQGRMTKTTKNEIVKLYKEGKTARQILPVLSNLGVRPQQVYNVGRNIDRRRSNRGVVKHVDFGMIDELKMDGQFLSERTFRGRSHFFKSSNTTAEILRENLVPEASLQARRDAIAEKMNAIFEEGGDVSTSKVNEKGVGQIDVTYNLAEGFYVTVFTIDALQFRIDKRISLIFARLSVRSRLEAGVASHFPDSNRIENVNRQLKSYLERRRRTLDQAINLLIEQLESAAGSLRMAPSGGGYHETMDAFDLSRFPSLSVSREVSKLPEMIWPVPCGEHRYALEKKMLEWNVQPVERGYRLSNAEGRLVGLTVLDEGELRCTAIECSKMRSLCVHRLRVISLVPGSCTEEFYVKKS